MHLGECEPSHPKQAIPSVNIYPLYLLKPFEDTENLLCSILKGGLCLLAIKLPSLWAIICNVRSPTLQWIASIRRARPLRPLGSDSHRSSSLGARGAIGGRVLLMVLVDTRMAPRFRFIGQ